MFQKNLFHLFLLILLLSLLSTLCYRSFNLSHDIFHDPLIDRIKNDVVRLDPRIAQISFYASNESFTEDKKKIFLCLRDEHNNYYDYNFLIYVAIHECSHALTSVIDVKHETLEFISMFNYLKNQAHKLGIYDPSQPLLTSYCKLKLK